MVSHENYTAEVVCDAVCAVQGVLKGYCHDIFAAFSSKLW